jgi:hypothetical protein
MTETRGFVCPVTGEPCTGPDCLRRHLLERAPEAWEFFDQRDETGSYAPCPLGCRAGLYLIFLMLMNMWARPCINLSVVVRVREPTNHLVGTQLSDTGATRPFAKQITGLAFASVDRKIASVANSIAVSNTLTAVCSAAIFSSRGAAV